MAETFAAEFANADEPVQRADGSTFSEQELEQALVSEQAGVQTPPQPALGDTVSMVAPEDRAVDRLITALDQRLTPPPQDNRPLPPMNAPTGLTPNVENRLAEIFPSAPPQQVQTPEQNAQYTLYRTGQAMRELITDIDQGATLQQSENNAKAQFSVEAVGEGYDYDSIVNEYVTPTMQKSPELQTAMRNFDNPGNLSYFLGLAAKLSHEFQTDPARAARAIAGSLKRPVEAARDLVGAAAQANQQPTLTPTESGNTASGLMDIFQRAIDAGDDSEFERLDKLIANQPRNNDFQ